MAIAAFIMEQDAASARSLPEHEQADPLACAYASHLDDLIVQLKPRLWIHGHIHHSSNYMIDSCHIVANPMSYPHKLNKDFVPDMTISL